MFKKIYLVVYSKKFGDQTTLNDYWLQLYKQKEKKGKKGQERKKIIHKSNNMKVSHKQSDSLNQIGFVIIIFSSMF